MNFDWRLPTTNGCVWRLARFEDREAIEECWRLQEKRLGEQDRPDLFAFPVLLTLVLEDGAGKIVGAKYVECSATFSVVGIDGVLTEALADLQPYVQGFLAEKGIRVAVAPVAKRLVRFMRGRLERAGFTDISEGLHFFGACVRKKRSREPE